MLIIQSKKQIMMHKEKILKKVFTTSDYYKFTNDILDAKITAKKLINESVLNELIKTLASKKEIKTLARKAELKAEQDKIVKLQTYYLSLFIGQSYFFNDGAQLYLIFQTLYYALKDYVRLKKLYQKI